jgi:hypothetical protein
MTEDMRQSFNAYFEGYTKTKCLIKITVLLNTNFFPQKLAKKILFC